MVLFWLILQLTVWYDMMTVPCSWWCIVLYDRLLLSPPYSILRTIATMERLSRLVRSVVQYVLKISRSRSSKTHEWPLRRDVWRLSRTLRTHSTYGTYTKYTYIGTISTLLCYVHTVVQYVRTYKYVYSTNTLLLSTNGSLWSWWRRYVWTARLRGAK